MTEGERERGRERERERVGGQVGDVMESIRENACDLYSVLIKKKA